MPPHLIPPALAMIGLVFGQTIQSSSKVIDANPQDSAMIDSNSQDPTTKPGRPVSGQPTTAEDILRAIQRTRPINDVVPSAGLLSRGDEPDPRALNPEGFRLIDGVGQVVHDGSWWNLVPMDPEAFPPLRLLPNATLESVVRSGLGLSSPPVFNCSGEFTVFRGDNYLLLRFATRSIRPNSHEGSQGSASPDRSSESGVIRGETPSRIVAPDGSTEDILSVLRQQRPPATTVAADPQPPTVQSELRRFGGATTLPEGSPMIQRPGRLLNDGTWWTVVFESDHPSRPEPPMRLLPNQSLELMTRTLDRVQVGVVFNVSGEVTTFDGENYLLTRSATRQIDLGNVRK